jgi:hypothetical protein
LFLYLHIGGVMPIFSSRVLFYLLVHCYSYFFCILTSDFLLLPFYLILSLSFIFFSVYSFFPPSSCLVLHTSSFIFPSFLLSCIHHSSFWYHGSSFYLFSNSSFFFFSLTSFLLLSLFFYYFTFLPIYLFIFSFFFFLLLPHL